MVLKRNNLLYTLPTLGKQFSVSFEVYINKFKPNWQNILHLTATGSNCCGVGDRVPVVWIHENRNIYICHTLNEVGNKCANVAVGSGEWISVQISQRYINSKARGHFFENKFSYQQNLCSVRVRNKDQQ